MAFQAPNRPSVPNVSNISFKMDLAGTSTERMSRRNERRLLPRITLPIVILAVAATFGSPAMAEKDLLTPKITTPASLDRSTFSAALGGTKTAIATAIAMPSTNQIPELRIRMKRSGNDEDSSQQDSQAMDKRSATTMTRSTDKTTSTTDAGSSPLPSPFDNPVPSAFQVPGGGDSCPKFMSELLTDPTFKSCYPISMLIQTSTSFFNAEKQLVSIVKVLDATCAADVTKCTAFLNKAAQNLTTSANCKTEFEQNQTQVLAAYSGLRAYKVLYSATCLQNPSSNQYCFANAVTNLTNPSDAYLYFMPYGLALPGASTPSCSWCTQKTMSIYHSASADRSQFVAPKYEDAARQVNTLCGPNFVNLTLPAAENGGMSIIIPSYLGIAANTLFTIFLFAWFL